MTNIEGLRTAVLRRLDNARDVFSLTEKSNRSESFGAEHSAVLGSIVIEHDAMNEVCNAVASPASSRAGLAIPPATARSTLALLEATGGDGEHWTVGHQVASDAISAGLDAANGGYAELMKDTQQGA